MYYYYVYNFPRWSGKIDPLLTFQNALRNSITGTLFNNFQELLYYYYIIESVLALPRSYIHIQQE
jgi:hypothetical protein